MAEKIKGITVSIGGDTVGLEKALSDVNKTSQDLQSELTQVNKLLKFDPNNTELITQKQKLLNDQIGNTEKKLKQLEEAEADVQEQFEKGTIKEEQYRAFQRELQKTQQDLRYAENALSDFTQKQEETGQANKQLTRLLESQNETLEDYADVLGTRLVRSIQQGTASSKALQKAFDLVGKKALGAEVDINEVRQALGKLDTGEASIKGVRKELQKLAKDADDAEGAIDKLGDKIGGLEGAIAGAGAGLGISEVVGKSLDMADLKAQIDVSMDLPDEQKEAVFGAVKAVEAYGLDAQEALTGVRRQFQLNGDLSAEENEKIIKYAGAIQKAYSNIDFTELIQENNEFAKSLGISQEEALGITKSLLDMGFPEDQLDIISEYGSQLSRAGYTAEEIQGVFASGIETKSWNIDNLLDGVKEGRILLAEFGAEVPDAIQESLKGTDISAKQVQEWGKAVAEGGEKGKQAMFDVALELSKVEDATKRNEIGTSLFGTLWEEQGKNITDTLIGAKDKTFELEEGTKNLAETTKTLDASPQVALNNALTAMSEALAPLFTKVAEFIGKVAEWVQANPELAGTILAVVTGVGILLGIIMSLFPLLMGVASIVPILSAVFAFLTSPIGLVILAITALIAIGILLYKNWDTIKAYALELKDKIVEAFKGMYNGVKDWLGDLWDKVKEIWGNVMDFFTEIDLAQTGKDIIQGLIDGIGAKAQEVWNKAKEIANGIGEKIASILKLGSPSKLLFGMGRNTGEGLALGIKDSFGMVKDMSEEMGKLAVPEMSKAEVTTSNNASIGKGLVVNLNSPKALDIREANKVFSRTVNKMSLMW